MLKYIFVITVLTTINLIINGGMAEDIIKQVEGVWRTCMEESGFAAKDFNFNAIKSVNDLPETFYKAKLCYYKKSGLIEGELFNYDKYVEMTEKVMEQAEENVEKLLECTKNIKKLVTIDDVKELTKCEMVKLKD